MNTQSPYKRTAAAYLIAGWESILPLPERSKTAPPAGLTGREGRTPTEEEMLIDWIEDAGNIALRLPAGVIGLDFDSYKDAGSTKKRLEKELGELPETIAFTSHEELEEGGTYFFSIPEGYEAKGSLDALDTIQHHHRYAVAPPSIHPSGRAYRAVSSKTGIETPWIIEPDALPQLPEKWKNKLALTERFVAQTHEEELDEFGSMCQRMRTVLAKGKGLLKDKNTSRHELLLKTTFALAAAAGEGHTGLAVAYRAYGRAWKNNFTDTEQKQRPLELELQTAIRGAKAKAPRANKGCSCVQPRVKARATVAGLKMNRY